MTGGISMKKTLVGAVLALATIFAAQSAFAADAKVGYVDGDRVLSQYPKFVAAQKQLAQTAERKEASAQAAFQKEKDENKKAQIYQKFQNEMAQEEEKVMRPILTTVNQTVQKVAKQKGMTVVVNKGIVYYGGTDITADVVSALKR